MLKLRPAARTTADMDVPLDEKPVLLPPLLRDALRQAQQRGESVLARLPEPHAPRDTWTMAHAALWSGERCAIWSDPEGAYTAVGLLDAWTLEASGASRFSALQAQLDALRARTLAHEELRALPLWFGGFGFGDTPHADERWRSWRPAELHTHAITFVKTREKSYIVLSLRVHPEQRPEELLDAYQRLRTTVATLRAMREDEHAFDLHFDELDTRAAWDEKVAAVHRDLDAGALQKLVLARRVVADWPEALADIPTAARLLPALRVMRQRYGHCTTFALARGEANGDSVFFGSTPELLVARTGDRVQTMALAGTAPRGANAEADKAATLALLASSKEREEHAFVVRDIVENLRALEIPVRAPSAPDVVSFPNVHHLCTPIHGPAPAAHGLLEIAGALHPTPAICGTTTAAAFAWLRAHEGIERGWYAGGIAWMNDEGEGRISVALRSGVADTSGVCAYAGAGIVMGSDAAREWIETTAKLSPVCDAFQKDAALPTRTR